MGWVVTTAEWAPDGTASSDGCNDVDDSSRGSPETMRAPPGLQFFFWKVYEKEDTLIKQTLQSLVLEDYEKFSCSIISVSLKDLADYYA